MLARARAEIAASCEEDLPSVMDHFAGGGSVPLEAQRPGLESHASDLNPVAVLINKALIAIPPIFAGLAPVHSDPWRPAELGSWLGVQGLVADSRHYGEWMREQAEARIGIDEAATTEQLEHIAELIPQEWIAPAATGSPAQCVEKIRGQFDLGCDGVIMHGTSPDQLSPIVDEYARTRPANIFDGLAASPGA